MGRSNESCDPSTENTDASELYETAAGLLFIANLPHNSKSSLTPYVRTRTLLAIATAVRDQPVNACKRNSKKEKQQRVKQMKLARYRWKPYVRTQLAIATRQKAETSESDRKMTDITSNRRASARYVHRSRGKPSSSVEYCVRERIKRLTSKNDRIKQPCVRTQLAIATLSARKKRRKYRANNERIKRLTSKNDAKKNDSTKRTQLAIACLLYTSPSPRDS